MKKAKDQSESEPAEPASLVGERISKNWGLSSMRLQNQAFG
ncbi:hypothetical protein [Faecalibacterium sp.]